MSFVVRSAESVARRAVLEIRQYAVADQDDPEMAVQVVRGILGAALAAERRYISELIEDMPLVQGLPASMDSEVLCAQIVDMIDDRDRVPSIVTYDYELPDIVKGLKTARPNMSASELWAVITAALSRAAAPLAELETEPASALAKVV
jgi:hypothetical protein